MMRLMFATYVQYVLQLTGLFSYVSVRLDVKHAVPVCVPRRVPAVVEHVVVAVVAQDVALAD